MNHRSIDRVLAATVLPEVVSGYVWWACIAWPRNVSGQLLGAHVANAGLQVIWAGAMTLFKVNPLVSLQPLSQRASWAFSCFVVVHPSASLAMPFDGRTNYQTFDQRLS